MHSGMRGSRGGRGPDPPALENHKAIGFLSNTGPDPGPDHKKITKHSMLGHHRPTGETPFEWRFAEEPIMVPLLVVFRSSLSPTLQKML